MKSFIIIAVTVLAIIVEACAQESKLSDEQKAKVKQYVVECQTKEMISEEDLMKLAKKDLTDPSEALKCLGHCVFEKLGFIKDGEMQKDMILEKVGPIAGEDKTKQTIEKCGGISGDNQCDTAYKVLQCFRENELKILS